VKAKDDTERNGKAAIDPARAAVEEERRRNAGKPRTAQSAGREAFLYGRLQDAIQAMETSLAGIQQQFCNALTAEIEGARQAVPRVLADPEADLPRVDNNVAAVDAAIAQLQKGPLSAASRAVLDARRAELSALKERQAALLNAQRVIRDTPGVRQRSLGQLEAIQNACGLLVIVHQVRAGTAELEKQTSQVELDKAVLVETVDEYSAELAKMIQERPHYGPAPGAKLGAAADTHSAGARVQRVSTIGEAR
jgi:hypothetical protein